MKTLSALHPKLSASLKRHFADKNRIEGNFTIDVLTASPEKLRKMQSELKERGYFVKLFSEGAKGVHGPVKWLIVSEYPNFKRPKLAA